jgi:hypothetical protein
LSKHFQVEFQAELQNYQQTPAPLRAVSSALRSLSGRDVKDLVD